MAPKSVTYKNLQKQNKKYFNRYTVARYFKELKIIM